jgi:hypothetical protein
MGDWQYDEQPVPPRSEEDELKDKDHSYHLENYAFNAMPFIFLVAQIIAIAHRNHHDKETADMIDENRYFLQIVAS